MKVNAAISASPQPLMQAINGNFAKPLKISKFRFSNSMSAKKVSKREFTYYKKVVLVKETSKGKERLYISYYYRIPPNIPPELMKREWVGKEWARFKVFENINRDAKHSAQAPHALLDNITRALEDGYDPFADMIGRWEELKAAEQAAAAAQEKVMSLSSAMEYFLKEYDQTGTSKETYSVMANLMKNYFTGKPEQITDRWFQPVTSFTGKELKKMLQHYKEAKNWKNLTYNNKVANLTKIFGWLKGEKIIIESPMDDVDKMTKGIKTRHTYFDEKIIPKVIRAMLKLGPEGRDLYNFLQVVYYTLTRPDKETRYLRIKDIKFERNLIDIPDETAKGGYGGYIPLEPELAALFKRMKLEEYPEEYFIFGSQGCPGPVPTAESYYSNLFRKYVREPNGFNENFTTYSSKHTRIIFLYTKKGYSIYDIQVICRHQSAITTEDYLRDLGLVLTGRK